MKGCTSEWLLLDTEGVIVSPSADPRLNGGLSAGSVTCCLVLFRAELHCRLKKLEWLKCFTAALNVRTWSNFCWDCRLKDSTANQRGSVIPICGLAHANHWVDAIFLLLPGIDHSPSGFWLVLLACFLFSALPHPSHSESGFFSSFFSTARDWHRAEMQNNNPLITWALPVLGFICNGCESPQCLVITAFDLGNNVFTVALPRARRQCSSNPQCILVESHYTKTTRALL